MTKAGGLRPRTAAKSKKKRNVDEDHPDGARETLPVDASAPSRTVQVDRFWTNGGDVLSKTFPKGSGTQEETLHNSFLDPYIYIYRSLSSL